MDNAWAVSKEKHEKFKLSDGILYDPWPTKHAQCTCSTNRASSLWIMGSFTKRSDKPLNGPLPFTKDWNSWEFTGNLSLSNGHFSLILRRSRSFAAFVTRESAMVILFVRNNTAKEVDLENLLQMKLCLDEFFNKIWLARVTTLNPKGSNQLG